MRTPSSLQVGVTPANRFRPLIEAAVAEGVDLSHQVLQLTHGDTAKLRRDPAVPDDEIRFIAGTMTFLGVRVVPGAPTSGLADANGVIITPSVPELDLTATTKARKKSSKAARATK